MKRLVLFFAMLFVVSLSRAAEPGTMTSVPSPIVPDQSVTLYFDGGGNFKSWNPKCFIHAWLTSNTGETIYSTPWEDDMTGDADYDALDDKLKMTWDGVNNSGKYSITIDNLYEFFNVLEADKPKIKELGVMVRTQYSTGNANDGNRSINFYLMTWTGNATWTVSLDQGVAIPQNLYIAGDFAGTGTWEARQMTVGENNTYTYSTSNVALNMQYLYTYSSNLADNAYETRAGGIGDNRWTVLSQMVDLISGWNVAPTPTSIQSEVADILSIERESGIRVAFNGMADIELYNINGILLNKTVAKESFERAGLLSGLYILKINGKVTKVLVK